MDWAMVRGQLERGVRIIRAMSLGAAAASPPSGASRPSDPEPVQFIILGAARTGSTMLRHLLNSHPEICCHGEVMTGEGLDAFVGLDARVEAPLTRKLLEMRRTRPRRFLREFVLYPGEARAVGFKVKYEELVQPRYAWLLEWLKHHRHIRAIHLRRENRLKRLISEVTATRVYGVYNITSERERPAPAQVSLTREECLRDFALTAAREELFRRHFERHPTLEVTYEAIVGDRDGVRARLAEFLGVPPAALAAPTLKINPDDLRDVLLGHDDLAAALRDTPYAGYFGD